MITLWHNQRCSKSRQALALLDDVEVTVRKYLDDAPSRDELVAVSNMLGVPPSQMIRKGEKLFREMGLKTATEDALLDAMAAHPILIERPIAIRDTRAVIGRPPENVLDLLD
jgi:arsenate reductase